jgi:DnaJ-class molecular chaperone
MDYSNINNFNNILIGDNLYEILKIKNTANKEEIKYAFKKLALKYHPDKNTNNKFTNSENFIKIKKAYDILIGEKLKKEYELPWVDQENYPDMGHDQEIYELPYNHSAYNIVSETLINEEVFITEKIWKPIIAQQIFVVHGRQHYLKNFSI